MVNEEQVTLLEQGVKDWNRWREANFSADIDLIKADLSFADLSGANLSHANLSHANLSHANLSGTDLSYTDFRDANLSYTDFRDANLFDADLRDANLFHADLRCTNLNRVKLTGANLSFAHLYAAQVLETNFEGSTLTGTCIQDWQIGDSTILDGVRCDYIFRTYDFDNKKKTGRLPVDPDSTFAPGEFTQRFQIIASALETIDITFTEGIDWQAFFQSFQELKQQHPAQNIAVQGMEEKGEAFVVRLKVETEETGLELEQLKASIETEAKQLYATQLATLEAQYEERLRLQSEEIAHHRKTQSSLINIVETMAEKESINQTFQGPVGNAAGTNYGTQQNTQHNYASERQSLSGAAKEIRDLLDTLAETYNTTTDAGQGLLMKQFDQEVEKHPKWRRALKEGGVELMKLLFPPISIPWEMARVYLEEEA